MWCSVLIVIVDFLSCGRLRKVIVEFLRVSTI